MSGPLSIYVLIDALGWEVLRGRPFLDDVLPERRWLTTILGYSSGAIPTLLSGRTPNDHGHWNLFYRDPARSPFRWTRPLGRLPRALVENRVSRRALKLVARRLSGYVTQSKWVKLAPGITLLALGIYALVGYLF